MVQYYTLEQAAQLLRITPDKLKELVKQGKVRAFQDRGTLRFRTQEIDEMARSLGGSDPELPLGEAPPAKSAPPSSGARKRSKVVDPADDEDPSDDFDFTLTTDDSNQPGLNPPASASGKAPADSTGKRNAAPSVPPKVQPPARSSDSDVRLVGESSDLDFHLSIDDGPAAKSPEPSPRQSRLAPGDKKPDSDVRLTPPQPGSDSDVKMVPDEPQDESVPLGQTRSKSPSDSDIRLEVADKPRGKGNPNRPGSDPVVTEEIDLDQEEKKQESAAKKKAKGKTKAKDKGTLLPTSSPFELSESDLPAANVPAPPSSEEMQALEDSSSDFELTPVGSSEIEIGSDEKVALVDDDSINLDELSAASGTSGINLQDPVDSGISLESDGSDEMEFELTLDDGSAAKLGKTPKPASDQKDEANSEFELSLDEDPSDEDAALPSDSEFELSLDDSGSSDLAPDETDSASDSEFELTLDEEGGLTPVDETSSLGDDDKDLFEETDFNVPSLDEDSGSEAMALDESGEVAMDSSAELALDSSSEFDLPVDDSLGGADSDSQVVPLEGDESSDDAAATVARPLARGKAKAKPTTDLADSGRLDIDLDTGPEEDEELVDDEEQGAVGVGQVPVEAAPAEWGVLPVIFLLPCVVVLFVVGLMSWEMAQGMWGYHTDSKVSGIIIRPIASMFDDSLPKESK